jgi:hypothetical protein
MFLIQAAFHKTIQGVQQRFDQKPLAKPAHTQGTVIHNTIIVHP